MLNFAAAVIEGSWGRYCAGADAFEDGYLPEAIRDSMKKVSAPVLASGLNDLFGLATTTNY